jgi:hypothetical protein
VLNRYPKAHDGGFAGWAKGLSRSILGPSGVRSLRDGVAKARQAGRRLLPSPAQSGRSGLPIVLALENSYSLGHLLQYVEAHNSFRVLHWDGGVQSPFRGGHSANHKNGYTQGSLLPEHILKEQGDRLWEAARVLPEMRKLLHFSGVDCFPAMERRLRRFFESDVPEIARVYLEARSLLQAKRPVAVLAATMGNYGRQAVAAAARKEGVPFVVYQHGASGGHDKLESGLSLVPDHNDHRAADYVLVFGEGDFRYKEKRGEVRAKSVPVGSAALDHLKKSGYSTTRETLLRRYGLHPGKRTVMYVPTSMDGSIRAAPYRSRSPSRMFRMEQRIAEVFSEFPETQFVLKLPASPYYPCSPIAQLVRDRRLENCVVITAPFTSVIPAADLFVSDYSSTSFLEMLTTDRPILFCGYGLPWPRNPANWPPSVLEMWQERVAYADDLEEFLELLRTYLREGRFQPVQSSNTLLKLFGTHVDDGRSAERAHAFLESLAHQEAGTLHKPDSYTQVTESLPVN